MMPMRVAVGCVLQALSNQKYREMYEQFGDVGLMTGDVTINPNAGCIVMTTEVRRLCWRCAREDGAGCADAACSRSVGSGRSVSRFCVACSIADRRFSAKWHGLFLMKSTTCGTKARVGGTF